MHRRPVGQGFRRRLWMTGHPVDIRHACAPVSSNTHATGSIAAFIFCASRRRTDTGSHGLLVTKRRRDEQVFAYVRTDLLKWAKRNGWAATGPPPELTNSGLDTVLPGERHRLVLTGTCQDQRAAMIWCS